MKTIAQRLFRNKYWLIIILSAFVLGYYYFQKPIVSNFETTKVRQGDVIQEVSVTGRVSADAEVYLAFERGGRIVSEPKQVGAMVKRGEVLVRLDSSELSTLRTQARANYAYEVANLAQIKSGVRPEDIAISQSQVDSALVTLNDARVALVDKLSNASTVADDAIFNKTDNLFENPRTTDPKAIFPAFDDVLVGKVEQDRVALTGELEQLSTYSTFTVESLAMHKEYFLHVKNYLDELASVVNGVAPSSQFTQTIIDGWKASVSLARGNMNTTISALLAAETAYRSADSALDIANNQLALKSAGATPEAIAAQEARIAAVDASIANFDAQIAKTVLLAPFSGVITKQDGKLGQNVAPNAPIVSVMSSGKFKIEANVPEVDVAKLAVGNMARITLDAYGSDVQFNATLTSIDPAETIIEGVSTYKITLYFTENDERVRSGMTANIDIATAMHEGVLVIPARAVNTKDNLKYVRVLFGETAIDKEVVVGLRGSDGTIEVISGLKEGDEVITYEPN